MTAADTNALIERREVVSRWTPRVLIGLAVVVVLAALYQLRPDPPPLSPRVESAIVAHQVDRVVDSAEIKRLRGEAATEKRRADVAATRERSAMASVSIERHRADSLAAIARRLDSVAAVPSNPAPVDTAALAAARAWHLAYDVRTLAFDSLASAKVASDSVGASWHRSSDHFETALQRSEAGRANGDSLIAQLTTVARARPPTCRVLPFIPCPSRKVVAVTSAALTLSLAKGWLTIPILR